MKRGGKTFICLLGGVALALGAKAITGDPRSVRHGEVSPTAAAGANSTADGANPFETIVARNVFDLKDPPPPQPTNAPEPPANVKLTGIMSIFGKNQALFMVQKMAGAGKPEGQPVSFILSEGQRQDGLEVLEIDPPSKKVKIKNDGVVSTITFEVAKATGPGPGQKEMPHLGRAGGFTPNMNPGGAPAFPMRPVRGPNMGQFTPQRGAGNPGYNPAGMQTGYNGGGGYNVAGGTSAAGYNPAGGTQFQQQQLTPEEQTALILANQQVHQDQIAAGTYPPAPPLAVFGGQQPSSEQQSTSGGGQQAPSLPSFGQRTFAPPVPH